MVDNIPEQRINIFAQDPAPVSVRQAAEPEGGEKEQYASFTERLVALLIDCSLIFIPGQLILVHVCWKDVSSWGDLLGGILAVNAVFVLYMAVFSCGGRVSLGKKLVGIAVTSAEDPQAPIGFIRALLRSIGYYISGALFMCGFLMSFFEERKRALQDFLGHSVVVRIRPKSTGETVAITLTGFLLILLFGFMVYQQVFARGSLIQQAYIFRAEKTLEDLGLLEEVHRGEYGYFTNDLQRLVLLSGDPVQFQRDIQSTLDRRGFRIGVSKDTYKIVGHAKDVRRTQVIFIPYRDR